MSVSNTILDWVAIAAWFFVFGRASARWLPPPPRPPTVADLLAEDHDHDRDEQQPERLPPARFTVTELADLDRFSDMLQAQQPSLLSGGRQLADHYRKNLPDVPDVTLGRFTFVTLAFMTGALALVPPEATGFVAQNLLAGASVELTEAERSTGEPEP